VGFRSVHPCRAVGFTGNFHGAAWPGYCAFFGFGIRDCLVFYMMARKGERSLLVELVEKWGSNVSPLVEALSAGGWRMRDDVHGKEWGI